MKKNNKEMVTKSILFVIGVFIVALNYNLFVMPNSFVLGGAGGIAIILNKYLCCNIYFNLFI